MLWQSPSFHNETQLGFRGKQKSRVNEKLKNFKNGTRFGIIKEQDEI
jgi:hypothetical protein